MDVEKLVTTKANVWSQLKTKENPTQIEAQEEEERTLLRKRMTQHLYLATPKMMKLQKKKFMGHVKKKKNEVTYSNSESKFNPSYEELQQAL